MKISPMICISMASLSIDTVTVNHSRSVTTAIWL